jgi:hypothetical protein
LTPAPQQPDEIPYRETQHDDGGESDPMYPDYWPVQVGHVREMEWDGTDEDARLYYEDVERRDRARAKLGGFGFR